MTSKADEAEEPDGSVTAQSGLDLRDRGGAALLRIFLGVFSHAYLKKDEEKTQRPAFVLIETALCQNLDFETTPKTSSNCELCVSCNPQARWMAHWSLGQIILAIAIFLAPLFLFAMRKGVKKLKSKSRHCIQMKWEDIPDGRLHECIPVSPWYRSCFHAGQHTQGAKCWESATSIATIFNRAWQVTTQNHRYAKQIPEHLPMSSPFVCSDAQTVLAFILCTVGKRYSGSWQPQSLTIDRTRVVVETLGATPVAHIEGSFQDERQSLTKHELGCMLIGWPPWYRQSLKTRNGLTVPFPIASQSDIPRAGWILAVGLMDSDQASQKPLALYRCPNEPSEPAFRQNGGTFRKAVKRCRDHIVKNLSPQFPGNLLITDALAALNHLVDEMTGSGMPNGVFGKRWSPPMRHLSFSQCQFVFKLFNDYTPLSQRDRTKLEPILLETLAAAVHGAFEVIEYLKDGGIELKIPPELQPFHREVWLRDCTTRLPIK